MSRRLRRRYVLAMNVLGAVLMTTALRLEQYFEEGSTTLDEHAEGV